jgi:predicted N-acyltransferase
LNDFSYSHLLIFDDNDNPLALASFYTITTDIAIFASGRLKSVLSKIRQAFPNFLKVRMIECGTPITLNKPFVANGEISNSEITAFLANAILNIAKSQGQFLIVLRDFEAAESALEPILKKLGYHWVNSLPTTYMDILWSTPDEYQSAMKSYYRSKLQRHLRINKAQGIRHELRDNFDELAEILCKQWQVVHDHADEYQREILTPEFYRQFSLKLGSHSKVLLFYREDELVGHALLLLDGDLLRWLYFGRNEPINDSLYIYVCLKVVESAILLGAKRLELGLTTYSIKRDFGAYMSPIKLALRSPRGFINLFIGIFYPLLNHTPEIRNKNIFKNS